MKGRIRPVDRMQPTLTIAVQEAKRLARENPGQPFCVYEAVEMVIKHDVEVVSLRERAPGAQKTTGSHSDARPRPPRRLGGLRAMTPVTFTAGCLIRRRVRTLLQGRAVGRVRVRVVRGPWLARKRVRAARPGCGRGCLAPSGGRFDPRAPAPCGSGVAVAVDREGNWYARGWNKTNWR